MLFSDDVTVNALWIFLLAGVALAIIGIVYGLIADAAFERKFDRRIRELEKQVRADIDIEEARRTARGRVKDGAQF